MFVVALSDPVVKLRFQLIQLTFLKLCNSSAGGHKFCLSFTNFVLNSAAPQAYAYLNTVRLLSQALSGPVNDEPRQALVHTLFLFSFSSVNECGLDDSVSTPNKEKKFSSSVS